MGDPYQPELIVRDLDMDLLTEVRNRWAFYRDRRPDAYDDLVRTLAPFEGSAMTILIKNGTRGDAARALTSADVLIDGETIAAVLAPGQTSLGADLEAEADRVIDAAGKYVIPGGIDAHTHMELPFGGTFAVRHLRDRHARRGVGRHDHDHRLRRPEATASASRTASPRGTRRPPATAPSTTASTRSSAGSTTTR